jgi:hypothetical protein
LSTTLQASGDLNTASQWADAGVSSARKLCALDESNVSSIEKLAWALDARAGLALAKATSVAPNARLHAERLAQMSDDLIEARDLLAAVIDNPELQLSQSASELLDEVLAALQSLDSQRAGTR